ncbi:PcfJ domain-containing protein [Vibrio sp. FNV 38]|nr:PcfJ domain-containing protein [Vibrio sp. FNV 38]
MTGSRLGKSIAQINKTTRLKLTLYIEDTLRLGQALGVQDPMQNILHISSHEALIELHDEWVRRTNQARMESMKPIDADKPYKLHLDNLDHIQQITDYHDLCKEGNEMHHCISVYHNRISQGRYVVFRVTQPERATVGIRINPKMNFPYEVEQIAGVRNALPSNETREVVHSWLQTMRHTHSIS